MELREALNQLSQGAYVLASGSRAQVISASPSKEGASYRITLSCIDGKNLGIDPFTLHKHGNRLMGLDNNFQPVDIEIQHETV